MDIASIMPRDWAGRAGAPSLSTLLHSDLVPNLGLLQIRVLSKSAATHVILPSYMEVSHALRENFEVRFNRLDQQVNRGCHQESVPGITVSVTPQVIGEQPVTLYSSSEATQPGFSPRIPKTILLSSITRTNTRASSELSLVASQSQRTRLKRGEISGLAC